MRNLDRPGHSEAQNPALDDLLACRERAAQLERENAKLQSQLSALQNVPGTTGGVQALDLLNVLLDNLPALIFFKDRASRFVLSNAAHLRNLGASSMADVVGKDDLAFHSPEVAHAFIRDEQQILETGVPLLNQVEFNPAPDGTPRYFETSKFPWRDGSGAVVGTLGIAHDITDRILAEQNLKNEIAERKQSESFLDAVVDNLPTMLFVKAAEDLRITRWNKAAEQITGLSTQTAVGKTDYDFFPTDQADFFVSKDRETLRSGTMLEIEQEPLETPDRGTRLLRTKKIPILDANGKPEFLLGISEDITEKLSSEQAREREAFQNAVVQAQYQVSPDAILVVGSDDRLLSYNQRFVEMWNIPAGALATGNVEVLRQAARDNLRDVEGWLRNTAEIYKRGDANSQDEIEFRDGRIFERYSTPIKNEAGEYLGRVWFFHDISAVRLAEQDIRRIVEGTRAIYWRAQVTRLANESEQALGFAWTTNVSNPDAAMQYLPFNLAAGQSYEDALYNATLEADRVKMDVTSSSALRAGLEGYVQEYRVRDANGVLHWMYEDARIRQLDPDAYEVVGVTTDVTQRKQAEQEIQKQNAYLQALNETSLGLMQRRDVNSLLQDIVARAGALVGTENGYVFLQDPDSNDMELRVGVGAYEGFVGRRTQQGVGLAGQVWEQNAPVVVDDYRSWGGRLADASRDILRAVAGVPLRSGADVIGIIGLAYLDETRKFDEAEIQVLQRFAQLATIALDNARLYETAQMELNERARAEQELAVQLGETELLNRVTGHAVSLDVEKALIEICREMADYFRLEQAGIALLTEDRESLRVVADHSPADMPSVVGLLIPIQGNPSTEIVLETRRAVAFSDAQNDPRLSSIHALMKSRGVASILIAPLFVRDEIIGTIGIDSYEEREFTERDIALVERVALSISTALENARLYRSAQQELAERTRAEQQVRQRNQELEVISRVSAVMTTDIDTVTALETLARELVVTFRARNCGIALLNPEQTELTVVADALAEGHEEHAVGIVIPMEGNLSSQYVVDNKRSLVIRDAQTDPMTEPIHDRMRQRNTKCLAIIPLLSAGDVIGTIGLDTTDPNHIFSEEEIRLAETMANQMANAIEKQRLFDQTKARARREQLTREIGASMTRTLEMETILQTMARDLSRAVGASHAVVQMGPLTGWEGGAASPDGEILQSDWETPALTRRMVYSQQTDSFDTTQTLPGENLLEGTAARMRLPVELRGQVIGTVDLIDVNRARGWNDDERALASTVVEQLALAVENSRLYQETEQRARETQIINEMASAISGELDSHRLFQTVYEALPRLMPTDAFIVWLYDDETKQVTRPALYDLGQYYPDDEGPRAPVGSVARVVESLAPLAINNTRQEWELERQSAQLIMGSSEPAASRLYVPLRVGSRLRGIMSVQTYRFDAYGAPQIALLTSVANTVATALENAQLFAETNSLFNQAQQALAETRLLYSTTGQLNQVASLEELVRIAAQPAFAQGAGSSQLLLMDYQGQETPVAANVIVSLVSPGVPAPLSPYTHFSIDQYALGQTMLARPRELVIVEDVATSPVLDEATRHVLLSSDDHAIVLMPLTVEQRVLGAIAIGWSNPHYFTDRERRIYHSLAGQLAVVLNNRLLFEQTEQALAETQTLYEISARLNAANNMQESLEAASGPAIMQGASTASLLQLVIQSDGSVQELEQVASWPRNPELGELVPNRFGIQNIAGESVWLSNPSDPLLIENILQDERVSPAARLHYERNNVQATAVLPLKIGDRWIGLLTFDWRVPHTFSPRDVRLFRAIMAQAATVLDNRRAEEAVRQQNTYLTALHDTTLGLMRRLDLDELLQNIIARAGELVGTEHGYVHLIEPNGSELRMRVGIGIYQDFVGTIVKPGQGLAGTVWARQEPIVVDDYREWPGRLPMVDRDVLRAVAGVPLKSGSQTVGVLGLASLQEGWRFGPAQIQALDRFAELAAVALDNAQLYESTQKALEQTQRVAEREKASAEIADKLYAAPDVKSVMRAAAEELRKSTGSRRAIVRLNLAAAPTENGKHDSNGSSEN